MTCPSPEKWELMSMDLLDEQEADAVRRHAEGCEECRAAYLSSRRANKKLLRAFEVFDQRHDLQREELMAPMLLRPCCCWIARRRRAAWSMASSQDTVLQG